MKKFGYIVLFILCIIGLCINILGFVSVVLTFTHISESPSLVGSLIGLTLVLAFWIWIFKL